MDNNFGTIVRNTRKQKQIGLRKFATMTGLSPAYISQMELGSCKPPKEENIIYIAEILGIPVEYLLATAGKILKVRKQKQINLILSEYAKKY